MGALYVCRDSSFRQWVQVVRDRLRSLAQLVRTVLWSLWGDSGGEVEWS